jgi:carboxyl-terminal processing protease
MSKRAIWLTALCLGLAIGAAIGVGGERLRRSREQAPVATAQTFETVLSAIRENFVDSLTEDELYAKAAKGVVTTLGDPYSTLLSKDDYRRYKEILDGAGLTLGLSLTTGITGMRVAAVVPGSPADRAGITKGDFVTELEGRPTEGLSSADAAFQLRPEANKVVDVRLRAVGDSIPISFSLRPDVVDLPSVQGALQLTDSIGYLALRTVSSNSSRLLRRTLDELRAAKLRAVVIDLRDNPGGRLDEGLAIADLFLDPGQRIGAVAKRGIFARTYEATHRQPYPELAIALLVNSNTASSAEIIAAALKDHRRAVLVGERTRGKGLIQTTIPLGDSLAVRLSTLRWESSGGTAIVGGIIPDSVVPAPSGPNRLTKLFGGDEGLVARSFETLVRAQLAKGVTSADSAWFGPAEVEQLRLLLAEGGLELQRGRLDRQLVELDFEFRRIFALMTRNRLAADRWVLRADPVVMAALAKLNGEALAESFPGTVHHP